MRQGHAQLRRIPHLAAGLPQQGEGTRRVPYRLPEVITRAGEDVHIAEGEWASAAAMPDRVALAAALVRDLLEDAR